ncbi:MAG: hypothetical protein AAGF11_49185 [Myxococcota bacterium]
MPISPAASSRPHADSSSRAHAQSAPTRWARRQLIQQLRRIPPLHRAAKEVLVGAKLLRARWRQAHRRLRGQTAPAWTQSTLRFETPLRAHDDAQLRRVLLAQGLRISEGRHTLYLPPQPGLRAALGPVVEAFPPDSGFKVLRRFAPPERARYTHQLTALSEAALLGGIHEQALAAAALASVDLGPSLLDVVHLRAGSTDLCAMVVAHVEGRSPTMAEYAQLIDALERLQSRGWLTLANPSRYTCGDFAAPGCNGNLLVTDAGLRYVDPQLFMFDLPAIIDEVLGRHRETLHFGDRLRVVAGGHGFLYQGLPGRADPGRRDPDDRWRRLDDLLATHGASPRGRVVFDVCCNAGLMMAGALHRGARWACGWDLPAVATAARELLPLLGAGRSTVTGRSLGPSTSLADDLPPWLVADDALCLFLAAWHHVGFPAGVGALPWRWLVYEGREHEEASITAANIATMQARWQCRAVGSRVVADGLCGPRPLVLLARHPS